MKIPKILKVMANLTTTPEKFLETTEDENMEQVNYKLQ